MTIHCCESVDIWTAEGLLGTNAATTVTEVDCGLDPNMLIAVTLNKYVYPEVRFVIVALLKFEVDSSKG